MRFVAALKWILLSLAYLGLLACAEIPAWHRAALAVAVGGLMVVIAFGDLDSEPTRPGIVMKFSLFAIPVLAAASKSHTAFMVCSAASISTLLLWIGLSKLGPDGGGGPDDDDPPGPGPKGPDGLPVEFDWNDFEQQFSHWNRAKHLKV